MKTFGTATLMTDAAEKLDKAKAATTSRATPARAISEQEARFASAFVASGGDRLRALRESGYAVKDAATGGAMARKLLARPQVAQAIAAMSGGEALIRKHIEALRPEDAVPVALPDEIERYWTDVMRGTVKGEPALLRVQLRASELLAQRHGMLEGKGIAAPVVVQSEGGVSVHVQVVRNGRVPILDATPSEDR